MGAPTQKPNPNEIQVVPGGMSSITSRSFTELRASGAGVATDVSCDVCPNAAPQANALINTLAANNLVITPPARVLSLFGMDIATEPARQSQNNRCLKNVDSLVKNADSQVVESQPLHR
jgi:hypothetical protein